MRSLHLHPGDTGITSATRHIVRQPIRKVKYIFKQWGTSGALNVPGTFTQDVDRLAALRAQVEYDLTAEEC